jgi:hypothetical protein
MPHAIQPKCRALGRGSPFFTKKMTKCKAIGSIARGIAVRETVRSCF